MQGGGGPQAINQVQDAKHLSSEYNLTRAAQNKAEYKLLTRQCFALIHCSTCSQHQTLH